MHRLMHRLLPRLMTGQHRLRPAATALIFTALLTACGPSVEMVSTLPDIRFITVDGRPLGPAEYRGKPVLINFWSTTCSVCLKEMPLLQAMHEETSDGLTVVAAAMPYDRPSDVVEMKALKRWGFHVTIDPQGNLLKQMGKISAVPTTALFDSNGKRVWFHQGELKEDALRQAVQAVLNKPS